MLCQFQLAPVTADTVQTMPFKPYGFNNNSGHGGILHILLHLTIMTIGLIQQPKLLCVIRHLVLLLENSKVI